MIYSVNDTTVLFLTILEEKYKKCIKTVELRFSKVFHIYTVT